MAIKDIKAKLTKSVSLYTEASNELEAYLSRTGAQLLDVAKALNVHVNRVETMLRVGRGEILPTLGYYEDTAYKKLRAFPRSKQLALLRTPVPVLVRSGTEYVEDQLLPRQMSSEQAHLAFTQGYQRSIQEQREHIALLARKRQERLETQDYVVENGLAHVCRPGIYSPADLRRIAKEAEATK